MRYLTKEWYDLCQLTDFHFGKRVHKDTARRDEDLYLRLNKRKEKEFIKLEREMYDLDPRFMLEADGSVYVRADKFMNGDELREEDTIVYTMSAEEKDHINKLIEMYDSRAPFDVDRCRIEFKERQRFIEYDITNRLPGELYAQIADPRVFALGYCTKEILTQLKRYSRENEKRVREVLSECAKTQKEQDIPEIQREKFSFHDCEVTKSECSNDLIFCFNTSGGFSNYNKIIFHDAKITKQEMPIEGSIWLYEELYHNSSGYEAHMLFTGEAIHELTISCKEITVDNELKKLVIDKLSEDYEWTK